MDEMEKVFESAAEYFSLLSEPSRLKIMHCLCDGERSVNEVVAASGLNQANASRHLNMLYRAGVVGRRRDGVQVMYRLIDPISPNCAAPYACASRPASIWAGRNGPAC